MNYFHQIKDDAFPVLLASFLIRKVVPANYRFYSVGEPPSGMWLTVSGQLAFVAVPSELGGISNLGMIENMVKLGGKSDVRRFPYILFGPGNYVGEWEIISPQARKASLRAETESEVRTLID